MIDISKFSTSELTSMKMISLRMSLYYLAVAKGCYKAVDRIDAEIERRKELDKDDRKKQMTEALSKALFESTLSNSADK